jgi:hypothetical protein
MDGRSMKSRVVRLGSPEAGDQRMGGTLEDRVAALAELTLEAWRLSGRPFPTYTRATMPILLATLSNHAQ